MAASCTRRVMTSPVTRDDGVNKELRRGGSDGWLSAGVWNWQAEDRARDDRDRRCPSMTPSIGKIR